jgi:TolB protein
MVKDLGSSNHTYLNGEVVTDAAPLESGDRIGIGETEFTFTIPGVPAPKTVPAAAVTPVPPTVTSAAARSAPPRLAWIAGGFVLLLCLVAVVTIYMISRDTGSEEIPPPPNVSDAPPSGSSGDGGATVVPIDVPPPPEDLTLIYEDDFSDSFGGWDDAFDAYTTKQYGNNRYQIEVSTDNLIAWGMANREVADFELEVEARQEDGARSNSYGLLFRLQDRDNFYRYDVSGDGFFLLSKFEEGQWHTLIDWTQSDFINPDTNILKVSAFGPNITVWANGQALASVTDESFERGNFGFFASTFSEPYMWVSFDNLKLSAPAGQQLTLLPTSTRAIVPLADSAVTAATVTPTPPSASDTVSVIATPTGQTAASTNQSPLPSPTTTGRPTSTPTSVPLPEYASRDQPLARGEEQVIGRIVFPVFDVARGTYDIFIANAADGSDRQLVQAQASQPGLTLDGRDIAYRSWQPDNRGMFARPLTGGEAWKFELFFESARPQYSPVDNSLMYHSRTSGREPAVYRVVDGVGQVMRGDGAPVQGRNPKWSPDAQQIVYNACLGGTCGIVRRNVDGTNPVMLTDHPSDTAPEISPDGATVVFMSQRSGDWDIYSVSINGGEIQALTDDDSSDGLPTWSPQGRKIAFVSNRDGEWSIWDMDPNGTNERRLFELNGSIDGQVQIDVANSYGWVEENIDWIP